MISIRIMNRCYHRPYSSMKLTIRFLFISALFSLTWLMACSPCYLAVRGVVVDQETGNPIDSVQIDYFSNGDFVDVVYTDANGAFDVSSEVRPALLSGECKEFRLEFSKADYEAQIYSTTSGGDSIGIIMSK